MKLTGAQLIVRKLAEHGVNVVFEFPGGSICPILDELHKFKKIKTVVTRHEQAAVHAADAYARLRKKTGVCMATSGPGASNLVTGIANAFMDSVPLVAITGQVAEWDLKKDSAVRQRGFQELDIVAVSRTITKKSYLVNKLTDLPYVMDEAFFIAESNRPGPVLIDIPINLQYTAFMHSSVKHVFKQEIPRCSVREAAEITQRLKAAKRPLIVVGRGAVLSSSESLLSSILKRYGLPVVTTLMGISAVPGDYDLNLGMVGYAGSRQAHQAVKDADFVLGLGIRFDNRAFPDANKEFSRGCYLVHVDCDRAELNHRVLVDKAILSDLKHFLELFAQNLARAGFETPLRWRERIKSRQKEFSRIRTRRNKLSPGYIISRISELSCLKDIIVTTDVGQHQLWTAQCFRFHRPNTLVTSGGLGTMGFGLPAAIGVCFARPSAGVINITSDGSLQMNIQELATVREYGLPVKIVLLNNRCLGLVRQIQEFAFSKRYESTRINGNIDFAAIARGYGIDAISVSEPSRVDHALKKIAQSRKSLLVDFRIDEFENVFPVRIKGRVLYK